MTLPSSLRDWALDVQSRFEYAASQGCPWVMECPRCKQLTFSTRHHLRIGDQLHAADWCDLALKRRPTEYQPAACACGNQLGGFQYVFCLLRNPEGGFIVASL